MFLVCVRDEETRVRLVGVLAARGWVVESARDEETALTFVEREAPDVIVLELADESGYAALDRLEELVPEASIVVLTPEGAVDLIVEAIKRGADHCLTLPLNLEAAQAVAARAVEKPLAARREASEAMSPALDIGSFERIIGNHPIMQRLLAKAYSTARSRATVLISGETGTGKELIATAIHRISKRAGGPFVRLNCASLAESVLESELFGHEKGAFTGAAMRRKGRFEQAHLGTLFLDEVSEIPPNVQVKLLRFLQEREFERVGGDETLRVDVRVVAATNRDLKAMVDDRLFREDLYYRLNVVRLEVPPLRARPSDIPLIAEAFLRRFAEENEKEITGFSAGARKILLAHPWPGNVRELQNVVEEAVVLCEAQQIDVDDLPLGPPPAADEPIRLMVPGVTMAELERFAILKTLEAVGGSPTKAASVLGISRRTIQYRLKEWGLAKDED
jgi:DNA-binding NtrC family response regulator